MKKILFFLMLICLSSCVIDDTESYLYKIDKITNHNVIMLHEKSEIVNELKLYNMETIDEKLAYEKISEIIYNVNSNKSSWVEKELKNDYINYIFFIKNDVSKFYNFTIELNFIKYNDGAIYYKQYDAWYMASLYMWNVDGFSFNSTNIKDEYEYKIISHIYFKVMSDDFSIYYLKVPMYINGNVNIINETIIHNIDI